MKVVGTLSIAISLLICVATSTFAGQDAATTKGAQYGFVDSDELRTVEVGGRKLSIPRRYFWGAFGATSGRVDGIQLRVLLPDFNPYSIELQTEFTECSGWCRQLHFNIRESVTPGHRMRFIEELADWKSRGLTDIEVAKRSYSGLAYLNLTSAKNTSEWGLFVDEGYYFSCSPLRTPKPSCTIQAVIDGRLEMRLTLSKDYRSQIPLVVEHAKQFVRKHSVQ